MRWSAAAMMSTAAPAVRVLRTGIAAALLAACSSVPLRDDVAASPQTRAQFAALGPGINFGNMLEAPAEGAWGSRVRDEYPALAWGAGFRHVRLPVRWSAHATADAGAVIDADFFARVDGVVDRLLGQGFTVVLNLHHYRQLDGDRLDPGERAVDAGAVRPRFIALWRQIATHYAGRPARLWFELYNEPHGDLGAADWNELAAAALQIVRASNPTRVVVIGPVRWNAAQALDQLVLPPDGHLVATVHDYAPFRFTHQQASWAGTDVAATRGVRCCDERQRGELAAPLDIAQRWSERRHVPVWLGEFGAYGGPPDRPNDLASRAEYTRSVREAAEQRGIAWAYWELDSGFGIYDPRATAWREPLLRALLPQR